MLLHQCGRQHAVERVDSHSLVIVGEQIPTLAEEFYGIGIDRLHIRIKAELLIAHRDGALLTDGLQYHGQELIAGRHVLQYDTVLNGRTLSECQTSSEH